MLKKIINSNKNYYEHISKYGKSLGKEMISKPEYEEPLFKDYQLDKAALNQTIAEHMCRSGYFTSGESFSEESRLQNEEESNAGINEDFKAKFRTLNKIVSELRD